MEFLTKTPFHKNNSCSLILANLKILIEPCFINLIQKGFPKVPKKWGKHLIFMIFGQRASCRKETQKKTYIFEFNNLVDLLE
jgi:hypothetical protein